MGQITVFSGPERRRRWSEEERVQIHDAELRLADNHPGLLVRLIWPESQIGAANQKQHRCDDDG